MTLDYTLFSLLNSLANRSFISDALIIFFAEYLPYLLVIFFIGFIIDSGYPKKKKIQMALIAAISTLIARFGITEVIRFFYHRPRPFLSFQVRQLIFENSWSFPSGHATFFFALSTLLYLYNKKWGTSFFIATLILTVCRVVAGVHYPSDILAGMIIGIGTAYGINQAIQYYMKLS